MKTYPTGPFDAARADSSTVLVSTQHEMISMRTEDALAFACRILQACRPGILRFTVEVDPVPWPGPEESEGDQ
jgi:hypothetical protein